MNDRSFTSRLIDAGIVTCLLVALGALIYGHCDAGGSGLSLTDSYITEYMKKAPHWPWLIVSSFAFALLLFLLAVKIMGAFGARLPVVVGCLLLAATAMGNFFVAYAPMRRVEQPPPPAHEWWTPTWWFTSQTSHTPYENGMADAYSDVHYRAIRLVVGFGIAAMCALAAGCVLDASRRALGWWTLGAAALMSCLFLMGDHWDLHRGLWQRLGFAVMYVWLWSAWAACRGRKSSTAEDNQW
ncbi:hypothetical protein [Prosthecobacter sp.]|jgi:hypothetical protein|uniref:hypothetical protein n=1 Tax=Prosthecobacter sp. TaxID=1965333 RepID=UPI0037842529